MVDNYFTSHHYLHQNTKGCPHALTPLIKVDNMLGSTMLQRHTTLIKGEGWKILYTKLCFCAAFTQKSHIVQDCSVLLFLLVCLFSDSESHTYRQREVPVSNEFDSERE